MRSSLKTYYITASGGQKHPVIWGPDAIDTVSKTDVSGATKGVIVTNTTVENTCASVLKELKTAVDLDVFVVVLDDGEHTKTMDSVMTIINACLTHKLGRKDVIFALGGGVVGDMAGFAAAIYLRGISFFQVPTSLLAQVDASIGGKTGVNHSVGKNLMGAFYQPKKIWIDPTILRTLPMAQMKEGLAEIIKYGVIMDKPLFWYIEEHIPAITSFSYAACPDVWDFLIEKSIQNKAHVVSQDEKESSLREILNYGHTIGHAIERVASYSGVSHGQAVALGMIIEARISRALNHLSSEDADRIIQLIQSFNYHVTLDTIDETLFFDALLNDKKVRQGDIRFVVPVGIGATKIIQGVSHEVIKLAVNETFSVEVMP
ncbi:MAG: 3-dehydroquinate synthase [Candidatus Marinamargulisbacteria bacterium]